jgi:hypothetical protein
MSSAQGLTLIHVSARRKHFLWDTLGGVSNKNGSGEAAKWTSQIPCLCHSGLFRGAQQQGYTTDNATRVILRLTLVHFSAQREHCCGTY